MLILKMSIYEFIQLDINSKADILWSKGVFLESHFIKEISAKLYYLNDFFVEVVISNEECEIIEIIPFKQGYRLEKYLNKIKL